MGVSTVLDFGGAFGVHYKEACLHSKNLRWAVLETPAMVRKASEIETDQLRFFSSISDAASWLESIDLMHSSGALQYVPDPERTLGELGEREPASIRYGEAFWRAHHEAWQQSTLNQREYCEAHGIPTERPRWSRQLTTNLASHS
jgi:putative methyltransferase (TIGR04325 family)